MTHKFPDAESIAAMRKVLRERLHEITGDEMLQAEITAALDSYRTRTGIDLADVSEKLAAKTHVLVPAEPTEEMLKGSNLLPAIYRAMIRAAK